MFSDFGSPLDMPVHALILSLKEKGKDKLANNAAAGKYDHCQVYYRPDVVTPTVGKTEVPNPSKEDHIVASTPNSLHSEQSTREELALSEKEYLIELVIIMKKEQLRMKYELDRLREHVSTLANSIQNP
jgi:hypothetical protein